jgi:hypothetical protein
MGKITSSSPIKTIAFDAIPQTGNLYTNDVKVHTYQPGSYNFDSTGSFYPSSTTANSNVSGNNQNDTTETSCPMGKHLDNGVCVKNKKKSRGQKLEDKIIEAESMGKTASAARLRKRKSGWDLSQKKRTKQIEDGQTFGGRLGRNIKDFWKKGYDADGDGTISASEKGVSRHDAKLAGVDQVKKDITKIKTDKKKADCDAKISHHWVGNSCVKKPNTTPNFNVNTSSTNSTSSQKVGIFGRTPSSYFKTMQLSQNPGSPGCPKGQHREGFTCVDD